MIDYSCKITKEREHDEAFLVALLNVPDFPDEQRIDTVVYQPMYCVVAATSDEKGWSFITLTPDEKMCICDSLVDEKVKIFTWYYCELYSDEYNMVQLTGVKSLDDCIKYLHDEDQIEFLNKNLIVDGEVCLLQFNHVDELIEIQNILEAKIFKSPIYRESEKYGEINYLINITNT